MKDEPNTCWKRAATVGAVFYWSLPSFINISCMALLTQTIFCSFIHQCNKSFNHMHWFFHTFLCGWWAECQRNFCYFRKINLAVSSFCVFYSNKKRDWIAAFYCVEKCYRLALSAPGFLEQLVNSITLFCLSSPKFYSQLLKIWNHFKNCYNLGHNVLRLFDVLPNFPFTASEINRDY